MLACDSDSGTNPDPGAPAAPAGVTGLIGDFENPTLDMMILWQENMENDIAGYNVYRMRSGSVLPEAYTRQNSSLITDDPNFGYVYIDTDFDESSSSIYYHYYVTAVDNDGNESPASDTIYCVGNVYQSGEGITIVEPLDQATGVSSTPTFTWRSEPGAVSYLVIMQHGAGMQNLPFWIFRDVDTSIVLGESTDYIYTAPEYTTLPDSTYRWQIFAIDIDNSCFVGEEAYFETGQ
jgi:hypothetical protein